MRRRVLYCLLLVCSLMASLSCSDSGAGRLSVAIEGKTAVTQVMPSALPFRGLAERHQSPMGTLFSLSQPSHRVITPRPSRYSPSNGGGSGSEGRWAAEAASVQLRLLLRQSGRGQAGLRAAFRPSRFYYVIALRRILC